MKDLEGKVALVTGSSTGLGLAIALELGARGAAVALNYAHQTDRAEKAQAKFNGSGYFLVGTNRTRKGVKNGSGYFLVGTNRTRKGVKYRY